jgi:acetylornithine deacetylase/succinyl-diaminopimelate desuccinylase-like protein
VAIRGAVQARREDAVSLLQELVRVPSETGEEGAVGAVVGRTFSERGLEVDTWEATREETGEASAVIGVPYGADMRLFIHFGGIPCVMYGAGDVNVAHAPDEHISITELLTATTTLAWCGVDED